MRMARDYAASAPLEDGAEQASEAAATAQTRKDRRAALRCRHLIDIVPTSEAGKTTRRIGSTAEVEGTPLPQRSSTPCERPRACRQGAEAQGAEERKSLDEVLRDTLIRKWRTDVPEHVHTDLDALAGSWVDVPGFDDAIEAQDRIDEALWR